MSPREDFIKQIGRAVLKCKIAELVKDEDIRSRIFSKLFKTVKYCPQFPSNPFETAVAATEWVEKFVHWYNEEHLHSGIKFVTPGCRHRGEDVILQRTKPDKVLQNG